MFERVTEALLSREEEWGNSGGYSAESMK